MFIADLTIHRIRNFSAITRNLKAATFILHRITAIFSEEPRPRSLKNAEPRINGINSIIEKLCLAYPSRGGSRGIFLK